MSPDDISCRGDVKSKPKKKQRKQKKRNKLRSQSGPPIKRNRHGADELSSKLEKMEIDNKNPSTDIETENEFYFGTDDSDEYTEYDSEDSNAEDYYDKEYPDEDDMALLGDQEELSSNDSYDHYGDNSSEDYYSYASDGDD